MTLRPIRIESRVNLSSQKMCSHEVVKMGENCRRFVMESDRFGDEKVDRIRFRRRSADREQDNRIKFSSFRSRQNVIVSPCPAKWKWKLDLVDVGFLLGAFRKPIGQEGCFVFFAQAHA